ncbi:MAG: hypothetical protein B1H08_01685 [Candidatus Omnitrophica bacterium 4484_171]|nr:MAG: hypothetical protein B1H08_01685 [Candidatus Omnitrophica bacterium 4484_171]
MERKDYFKEYFDSIFKDSNIFSEREYESHCKEYETHYREFLPAQKNATILDIGCGAGHFLYYLNKKGYNNFIGVDISPQQIKFCKKNISEKVIESDVFDFLQSKENIYDVMAANDLIEHLPKDKIITFLTLAFKALRTDGKLILKTPNLGNPFAVRLRYVDFTHEIGFTEKSLYQVLWIAGFRNIRIIPCKETRAIHKMVAGIIYFVVRKLMWYQGFVAPKVLTPLLIGVAKK